jgi:ABC-type sugar transport system ATPase subunit
MRSPLPQRSMATAGGARHDACGRARRCEVVALDEPLANLDVVLKQDLIALFASLLLERGAAALYVTHTIPGKPKRSRTALPLSK